MAGLPCFLLLFLFLPLDPSSSSLEAPLGLSDDEPQPGSSIKEQSTPSSPTAQDVPLSSSYSLLLVGNKLKISPNMDPPESHNKVKGAGTEDDRKKRSVLSDLKQDNSAGNNDGKSVRTTNITLRIHSTDNTSQTQIDIYNFKESSEVPEVHIVASSIIKQGIKIDSVVLKDSGLQVIVNSSVDKRVKHIPAKGRRKSLIKCDHGITGKNTPESTTENSPVTVLSTQEDNSQSIDEELEMPEKEIENILETLKEENSNPNDNLESSLMDSILQELKKHSEESVSTEENFTMTTESSSSESFTKEFSVEPELSQSPKPTPLPNLRVNEVNEDIKDAKRFEFFEKYEGIQDKKRAKTEDLKDLMKHIIIACVAVIGLILTVIVLVHIYNSLFVKKQQDPGVTNATVYKEDGTDKTEITEVEEKENQLLEYDNENLNNNSRLRSSPVISPAISCEDAIKPSRSS
ncbi:uncharacterized protein LOC121925492 isoform X2 [Sceloporus undulatus]|uniref:uncharacterized protein LOC121925492 isoform X2 n=1 Tax=Sceloporus undulatus TaxID=8520 RepID=UPI001C4A7DDC|nr:uncharacterized protein LOC121925492 isoform X2 [Sceloporus undulatus]